MEAEKDYTSQSIIASVVIHCFFLLICLLIIFHTPIPPYPSGMGVELNYGTVDEGYGDVQTLNKANKSPIKEEAAPSKSEENKPVPEEVKKEVVDEKISELTKPEKIQEEKVITTNDEESKVFVKKTDKKAAAPAPEVKKEKKVVDQRAVFGSSSSSNGTTGTKEQIAGNSNGDRPGKVGDQGDTRGTVDAKALYGNPGTGGDGPGGSGGSRLDMAGWAWDSKPVVKDESNESGKIVFEIKVNSDGELISARAVEKSVSPSVVQYYEREIRKLTFTKTSKGEAPATSTGRITIIITSR